MTSVRLNRFNKDQIIKNALNDRFKTEEENLKVEENQLAEDVYNHIFDKNVLQKLETIPSIWLYKSNSFYVNLSNGYQIHLSLKEERFLPRTKHYWDSIATVTDTDLNNRFHTLDLHKKQQKDNYNIVYTKIRQLVNSFSTSKQLEEAWPEGKEYFSFLTPAKREKINLPAPLISDINSMLGLPKEVKDEETVS